jgi:hypothetical protein
MSFKRCLGVMCGTVLFAAVHASAQGFLPGQPAVNAGQSQGGPAIGPNGTYYALVPGTGSTPQTPVTELVAVGPPTAPAILWTSSSLKGELGPILPGANIAFVVQTETSGSGRNTTRTTSVLLFSAASGSTSGLTNVTPSGNIDDIQVRTIGGSDFLYIYTSTTSSSTSNGTTTLTTTRTLTIYSQTGAVLGKPIAL